MFPVTTKLVALLNALVPADIEALPPARRQRLGQLLRHWADCCDKPEAPKPAAGVLCDLKDGRGRL